jgi:hypothetical protein
LQARSFPFLDLSHAAIPEIQSTASLSGGSNRCSQAIQNRVRCACESKRCVQGAHVQRIAAKPPFRSVPLQRAMCGCRAMRSSVYRGKSVSFMPRLGKDESGPLSSLTCRFSEELGGSTWTPSKLLRFTFPGARLATDRDGSTSVSTFPVHSVFCSPFVIISTMQASTYQAYVRRRRVYRAFARHRRIGG